MNFEGIIKSVVYNQATYYILDVASEEHKSLTVKGNVFGAERLAPGVRLRFKGKWVRSQKYGRQVHIQSWALPTEFTKIEAICILESVVGLDYLSSEYLYKEYGADLFESLDNADRVQRECADLGDDLSVVLVKWARMKAIQALTDVLKEGGLSATEIEASVKRFGMDAPSIIKENPFRLMEIPGFSFERADSLALRLGFNPSNPQRLEGAALWALNEAGRNGHLFLKRGTIPSLALDLKNTMGPLPLTDASDRGFKGALSALEEREAIVVDPEAGAYTPDSFKYERGSAKILADLMTPSLLQVELGPFLEEFEKISQMQLSEAQQDAVRQLIEHKVLVLTGLPGTGKCVTRDTIVSGPWGFKKIGGFLPEDTPVEACSTLANTWVDTSRGARKAAYVYNGGLSDTLRVRTKSGFELEGTPEHPIRVLRQGALQWVHLQDIVEGDIAILVKASEKYSFSISEKDLPSVVQQDGREIVDTTPRTMTPSLATILGVLTSEGSVVDSHTWSLTVHDPRMISLLRGAFEDSFGFTPAPHYDKRYECCVGYRLHRAALIRWFRQLGVGAELSDTKSIPSCILEATRPNVAIYLRSLFEGDGSVDPLRNVVEYGTASKKLADQLQVLLLAFGVVATKLDCIRGGLPFYRLGIYGEDYDRFRVEVGFLFTEVPERHRRRNTTKHLLYGVAPLIKSLMGEVRPKKGRDYNLFYRYSRANKPYSRAPSRKHLTRLLTYAKEETSTTRSLRQLADPKWFFDPVVSIDAGRSEVVDFGVPDGHEFLSSGFVSHNTTAVKALVRLFEVSRTSFALMAPTGIASKRLSYVTGHPASTIHRALGYDGLNWQHGPDNKYVVDAVIVDEVSMVDQELFYKLLSSLRADTMLVLVGDDAQLPSVGPGNVLKELVACDAVPSVRLTF